MKRTHTETVEYFEHDGDRYRRFADGTWLFITLTGDFTRPDFPEQLEVNRNQIEDCEVCKYYKENPHFHCAVHPSGPDGICGDWEIEAISIEDLKGVDLFLKNQSHDIPTVSTYSLAFYVGEVGETIYSGTIERHTWGMDGESLTEVLCVGIVKGCIMPEPYKHAMSEHFAAMMNKIWNISSEKGDTAIIKNGKVEKIVRGDEPIWHYPNIS